MLNINIFIKPKAINILSYIILIVILFIVYIFFYGSNGVYKNSENVRSIYFLLRENHSLYNKISHIIYINDRIKNIIKNSKINDRDLFLLEKIARDYLYLNDNSKVIIYYNQDKIKEIINSIQHNKYDFYNDISKDIIINTKELNYNTYIIYDYIYILLLVTLLIIFIYIVLLIFIL